MFSLKHVENMMVLLCFRSNMLNKHLVLLCFRSSMLKNQWFYRPGHRKGEKTLGFTVKPVRATGHRATAMDPGSESHILAWMNYEEPLQTSCLGNEHTGNFPVKFQICSGNLQGIS